MSQPKIERRECEEITEKLRRFYRKNQEAYPIIDNIFNLFGGIKSAKNTDNLDELVGLILHLRTARNSKKNTI